MSFIVREELSERFDNFCLCLCPEIVRAHTLSAGRLRHVASVGLAQPSPLPIGQERLGQGQTIQDGGGGQHYNPHIQANRLVRMQGSMFFGITLVVIQHIL